MYKIKKMKKKKLRGIIIAYRFISLALIGMLLFSLKAYADNKKPTIVKKEIINPNIVMLGDSITDGYDLDKYFGVDKLIVNSGISGNKTHDISENIRKRVYEYNPSKVFLLIGINDIIYENASSKIVYNQIDIIINEIKERLPNTKIYIESIYPVNSDWHNNYSLESRDASEANRIIIESNELLKGYCKEHGYEYIDVYSSLVDSDNNFDRSYTDDGLHPNERGYEVITKILKKYM